MTLAANDLSMCGRFAAVFLGLLRSEFDCTSTNTIWTADSGSELFATCAQALFFGSNVTEVA
jgi:hypothetical protein